MQDGVPTSYDSYWTNGSYGYSPGGTGYQIQTTPLASPAFSPSNFTPPSLSPVSSPYQIQTTPMDWPDFTPITPPSLTGNTEAVTAAATAPDYQIQTTPFSPGAVSPSFTPDEFLSGWQWPTLTPANTPTEEVTSEATRPPVPNPVHTTPFDFQFPALTPQMFSTPRITPVSAQPQKPSSSSKGTPAAGGGGSSGGGAKPQPPPLQPKPLQQQPVTPQQQQQLLGLTPAQLKQLLNNPNLTPAQRQAVQQALAQKQGLAASGGGGTAAKKPAVPGATSPASPLQPAAFALPILIGGGLAAAWALTHRHQVQTQVRSVVRRVRRIAR